MTDKQLAIYLEHLAELLELRIENVRADLIANGIIRRRESIYIGDPFDMAARFISSKTGEGWEERESEMIENLDPLNLFVLELRLNSEKLLGESNDTH